jgi:hypothetical protein
MQALFHSALMFFSINHAPHITSLHAKIIADGNIRLSLTFNADEDNIFLATVCQGKHGSFSVCHQQGAALVVYPQRSNELLFQPKQCAEALWVEVRNLQGLIAKKSIPDFECTKKPSRGVAIAGYDVIADKHRLTLSFDPHHVPINIAIQQADQSVVYQGSFIVHGHKVIDFSAADKEVLTIHYSGKAGAGSLPLLKYNFWGCSS